MRLFTLLLLTAGIHSIGTSIADAQTSLQGLPTASGNNYLHATAMNNIDLPKAPLLFTENKGQVLDNKAQPRPDVLFTATCGALRIYLTANGINYQFNKTDYPDGFERDERRVKDHARQELLRKQIKTATHRFNITLQGANVHPHLREEEKSAYTENFYFPHCPQGISDVHTYGRIIFEEVYPGIDWVIYSRNGTLEYDFIVHANANAEQIKLQVKDADGVSITENGGLAMTTSLGEVREAAPVSFSASQPIATYFIRHPDGTIGFKPAVYDHSQALVIDPAVTWATYYGGAGNDVGYKCATDASGNVYMAGNATSTSAIASSGGYQSSFSGTDHDVFLVKFNSAGVRQWATYYGGNDGVIGQGCTTDALGNVYLSGSTASATGIATTGAYQTTASTFGNAFLAKFSNAGTRLWATYYSGNGGGYGNSCATDASGNVFLSGWTSSTSGISSGGFQNTSGGSSDDFLVKFNSSGSRLWATYYGGSLAEDYADCATDASGNVFLTGYTNSTSNIASTGAAQTTAAGGDDAFVAKFSSSGARLWATYLGGSGQDESYSCATDAAGNVYIAGQTKSSTGISTSGGFLPTRSNGIVDAFLVKYNSSGIKMWGTYYGSNGIIEARSCATDAAGNVYLAGSTTATSNIASGGFQNTCGGATDAFLVKFSSAGARSWGTYYGGSDYEVGFSVAVNGSGNIFMAGETFSTSGVATTGAHQTAYGGGTDDGFLMKIFDVATAVKAVSDFDGLTIYPNPAQKSMTMALDLSASQHISYRITDIAGRIIYRGDNKQFPSGKSLLTVESSSWTPGTYFVQLIIGGGEHVYKVTKE